MKKMGFTVLGFSLILLSFSIGLAADPSGLIIVRASDNSLWKATCVGQTCTAFSSFPGMFASQPTVYWDENTQLYVVWGRASDNSIWRSTFNRFGNFNNDWVRIPGATASPIGAAGGGISQNTWFVNPSWAAIPLSSTVTNLYSNYVICPWDGAVLATSSGNIQHSRASTGSNAFARIYLAETSGGTASAWAFTDLPAGAPTGTTSFPYSISRAVTCPTGGGAKYVYVTGEAAGTGTTTNVWGPALYLQYVPYSY